MQNKSHTKSTVFIYVLATILKFQFKKYHLHTSSKNYDILKGKSKLKYAQTSTLKIANILLREVKIPLKKKESDIYKAICQKAQYFKNTSSQIGLYIL